MIICQVWDPALGGRRGRAVRDEGRAGRCASPRTRSPTGSRRSTTRESLGSALGGPGRRGRPPGVHAHRLERIHADRSIPRPRSRRASGSPPSSGQMALDQHAAEPDPQRFPDIKLVFSEAGIGWIPALLERADRQVDRHRSGPASGRLKPSEIFRPQHVGLHGRGAARPRRLYDSSASTILVETDYPHADTPFPHTQKSYAESSPGSRPTSSRRSATETPSALRLDDGRPRPVDLARRPDVASRRWTPTRSPRCRTATTSRRWSTQPRPRTRSSRVGRWSVGERSSSSAARRSTLTARARPVTAPAEVHSPRSSVRRCIPRRSGSSPTATSTHSGLRRPASRHRAAPARSAPLPFRIAPLEERLARFLARPRSAAAARCSPARCGTPP